MASKVIGVAISLSVALSVLASIIAPAVVDAQTDDNLSSYAVMIGIILLVFVAGLIMYVWNEFGKKATK